ncbi:hypothetical protein [Paraburkholderia diazotrophica]
MNGHYSKHAGLDRNDSDQPDQREREFGQRSREFDIAAQIVENLAPCEP